MESVRRWLKFDYGCFQDIEALSGGIALWWSSDIFVEILECDKTLVEGMKHGASTQISWYYEPPEYANRMAFWERLGRNLARIDDPWLV